MHYELRISEDAQTETVKRIDSLQTAVFFVPFTEDNFNEGLLSHVALKCEDASEDGVDCSETRVSE